MRPPRRGSCSTIVDLAAGLSQTVSSGGAGSAAANYYNPALGSLGAS